MSFRPLVSIVIPVYNGSNYVKEAIDSALNQTYNNIEIIVVNDGSTDNTEEIVLSYGDKVRYFYKDNGGTSTALNLALKNMKGEYFSWLSHDDMYYPDKIKKQVEVLEKLDNKETIIMTDLDGINENYEKIYSTNYINHINSYPPRLNSYLHPIVFNQTHGCTLLIARSCFDKVGFFDETVLVAQDFECFYRLFKEYPHKLISEILVTARDSSNRQGKRNKIQGSIEYSDLYINIIDNLSDNELKQLSSTKFDFYLEMKSFFKVAGYFKALEYINRKLLSNIQISNFDLIGNKFNGYDLHLYLLGKGYESINLVSHRDSVDKNTYKYFNNELFPETQKFIESSVFLSTSLVHMHIIHNLPYNIIDLNYLPIMSKLRPVIWTLHDPWALGGHCVHHFDCEKWKTSCGDCEYLDVPFVIENDNSSLEFEIKKQAIQNSNISIIVASKWMEDKVKESAIFKGKKIYRVPFGINQEIFKPKDIKEAKRELNIREDSITLMFRAEDNIYKGLDIIIKSLKNLKSKNNITLIGVGTKGLLKKLLGNYSNNYNIIDYNWIKDDNLLVKLYQASDIFLMPSRQETFGMMAIEAMSCAKMVLALNGTALPDIINSPECGIACSEEEYRNKLQYLIDNIEEIELRGKKSLDYAKKNYDKEIYINNIIGIYNKTLDEYKRDDNYDYILNQLQINFINNNLLKNDIDINNLFGFYLYNSFNYFIISILGLKVTFKKNIIKNKVNKTNIPIGIFIYYDDIYFVFNILGLKISFKKKGRK